MLQVRELLLSLLNGEFQIGQAFVEFVDAAVQFVVLVFVGLDLLLQNLLLQKQLLLVSG